MNCKTVLLNVFAVSMLLMLTACTPKPITNPALPDVVKKIYFDAQWYDVLYMRWTFVYWVLTLLAAGTAITAAVKNAIGPGAVPPNIPNKPDRWIILLAALTVVATVMLGVMHPAELADRYRMGDLLLQDAKMDWEASAKTKDDQQALLQNWHQAQAVLEGKIQPDLRKAQRDETPATAPAGR